MQLFQVHTDLYAFVRVSDFHFCLGGSFKCVKLLLSLKGSCTLESISCLPLESLENTSFGTPYECAKNISKNPLVMKYYDTSSYPEILDLLRSQRKGRFIQLISYIYFYTCI